MLQTRGRSSGTCCLFYDCPKRYSRSTADHSRALNHVLIIAQRYAAKYGAKVFQFPVPLLRLVHLIIITNTQDIPSWRCVWSLLSGTIFYAMMCFILAIQSPNQSLNLDVCWNIKRRTVLLNNPCSNKQRSNRSILFDSSQNDFITIQFWICTQYNRSVPTEKNPSIESNRVTVSTAIFFLSLLDSLPAILGQVLPVQFLRMWQQLICFSCRTWTKSVPVRVIA